VRRIVVAVLGGLAVLAAACSTEEVTSRASDLQSSAAAAGEAARNLHTKDACVALRDDLDRLGSLATRLARDPSLRVQLAPQVTEVVDRMTRRLAAATAQWRAEWREVLQAGGQLGRAIRAANEANVRVTAGQVAVVVKLAQAGCAVATR